MPFIRNVVLIVSTFAGMTQMAAAATFPATYQVPVETNLRSYAMFDLKDATVNRDENNVISISYCLPHDIAGEGKMIELTGTAPAKDGVFFSVTWEATNTSGQCVESAGILTCMLRYPNIPFNAADTEEYLNRKYAGDENLDKRVNVMRVFSSNAIGILAVDFN